MPKLSHQVHLVRRPTGLPKVDDFTVVAVPIADPGPGELLIRNQYMSIDPAMRPRLSNGTTEIGRPIVGAALGTVVASRHPQFREGDLVEHRLGFRDFALSDGTDVSSVVLQGEPVTAHLGVLGVSGLTAYAGLLEVAKLRDGERVFVSAAAGAVGSVAAQIAKVKGCYVVGSAGTEEKCAWLRETAKIDVAINYREGVLRKTLKAAAPEGIDVYFDNVGGEHLNAALPRMRVRGRIAVCGMISAYNSDGAISEGVTTLANMMYNRLTMTGFIWWDFVHLREQFLADMRSWIAQGRMHWEETILDGLENAPAALIGVLTGRNLGKMLLKIT
jgi:NADPH-dependent curcumin reductase CurA